MSNEVVWSFETAKLRVSLVITPEYNYQYDGDDADGETQANIDSGEYIAFSSAVFVAMKENGNVIASNYLGGSVYAANEVKEFWTAHRDPNAMNRNCSAMRAARGGNVSIGHYFPDMVREALAEARRALPHVRRVAE